MPLFIFKGQSDFYTMNWICTRASLGDAFITLTAFVAAMNYAKASNWYVSRSRKNLAIYLLVGIIITVFLEWLNTEVLDNWQYGEAMPTLPLLGTGLSPLMQWVFLPLVILGLLRFLESALSKQEKK